MNVFQGLALILSLTAVLSYFNERLFKLPTPIGVMFVSLLLSVVLLVAGQPRAVHLAEDFLGRLDFSTLVMQGLLSFLLFAGALHVNLARLGQQKWPILTLATVGVVLSTFLVGTFVHFGLPLLGLELTYLQALLFGALISPTDPIAVLGILRSLGIRQDVETLVVGESLFNDGVGVVVFAVIFELVNRTGHGGGGAGEISLLFAQEALGGAALGLALGFLVFQMLRRVDNYTVEILLTLALVTGGYALAQLLHTSGPIAMVVSGLLIGNRGREVAMSQTTKERLDTFWTLIDEILNAVLFVLIGLELLVVSLSGRSVSAALMVIPLVLAARFLSVNLPLIRRMFPRYTVSLLVWGGLRGGISVALALSIPQGAGRELILTMTYAVVVFAILVQGLTVGRVARKLPPEL